MCGNPFIQHDEVECKLPPNNDRIDCGDKTKTLGPKHALFPALTRWFWCFKMPSVTVTPLKAGRNNDESEENTTNASGIWMETEVIDCSLSDQDYSVDHRFILYPASMLQQRAK